MDATAAKSETNGRIVAYAHFLDPSATAVTARTIPSIQPVSQPITPISSHPGV